MKKHLFALIGLFYISSYSYAQDYGYRTFDIGAEYQYTSNGPSFNLQIGINSEEHHSIVLRAGYVKAIGQTTATHNSEEGSGWSGSAGYRYYFSVLPKRFFIGARAGLSTMDISWSTHATEGSSKILVFQPAFETGYTVLINDMLFITPHISAGIQTTVNNKGEKVSYGTGFLPMAGLSVGWRF